MAIPSSPDHEHDTQSSHLERSNSEPSPANPVAAASPSENPPPSDAQAAHRVAIPSLSRAGFVPIAPADQGKDRALQTGSGESNRAIVLPPELSSQTPGIQVPDAQVPEAQISEVDQNPFDADALGLPDLTDRPDRPDRLDFPTVPNLQAPGTVTRIPRKSQPSPPPKPTALPLPLPPKRPRSTASRNLPPREPEVSPPSPAAAESAESAEPSTYQTEGWTWPYAERAERWTRLKGLRAGLLRRRELIAAIGLWALISIPVHWLMQRGNDALLTVGLRPIQAFYLNHNFELAIALGIVTIAAPFLLDLLLAKRYQAQPLTQSRLAKYSPEAAQILTRFAQHKKRAKPALYTLNSPAAFVWTYGYGQRSLRLVISRGAIETLTADEIAIEVAAGIASGVQCDVFFATVSVALLQLPYALYDGLTQLGDRCQRWTQHDRPAQLGFDLASLRIIAAEIGLWLTAMIATIAYGIYRLLRLPLLAWSRLRQTHADRFAANLTGNPNARARSLVKQALTQRREFDQNQAFSTLSERFELLGSINPRHGLWCGANPDHPPIDRLGWDAATPYSTWLAIGDAHPPLGQRLDRLTRLAQHFQLEPEFLPELFRCDPQAPRRPRTPTRSLPITPASLLESSDLMQNMTPLIGVVAAVAFVAIAASLGTLGQIFQWRSLSWLQADWPWLTVGLVLEGFAIGTVLRINAFFPDFKPYALAADPDLDRWTLDPDSLPIDSRTLRLSGTLVGRRHVGNWFGQDLWLDDGSTLWPLHYLDRTGWLGWFLPTYDRIARLIGQPVTITGWFRRGVTPWIDVDRLDPILTPDIDRLTSGGSRRISSNAPPQNGHPLWSTALASLCALWGAVILARGGF
ncbi:MAG: M48 family metalloprotease [Coleofasciculaceae cyanobacterium RL_1_1]|nr:M48 family metalloprotease [Coleofasciculaceae cyanobacterium RL_1_1]